MVRSRPVLVGIVLLAMGLSVAADAQQKLQRLRKEQSRLVLDMPALQDGREYYVYAGWNEEFSKETTVAQVHAASGNYPRALVFLQELATNYVWSDATDPVDLDKVKQWSKFLQRRELTPLPDVHDLTLNYLARTVRFSVDNTECLAFAVLGGVPGVKGDHGANAVFGYYCSAVGAKLSPGDMRRVLAGWKIVPRPEH